MEVRGIEAPVVVAAFVTRGAAFEYRDEYNAEFEGETAYACLCDCPERECAHLMRVEFLS